MSADRSSLRVAIAGAGIGGMTLAALLGGSGHEVILVEKATAFGEVGAGIQISPNGARVLAAIDLADGSSIEADVVIGADGIHSPVRTTVFGPGR